jgi:hypothetical protein
VNDGCFVSWPLRATGLDDLRETVVAELDDTEGSGLAELLPLAGVSTVSLFVHEPDDGQTGLVWYVEHDRDERWRDPARIVREHSPLFRALAEHLTADEPTVVAEGSPDATSVVHMSVPGRPRAYANRTDDLPAVLSDDDSDAGVPDVVPLRLTIRPGLGSLFACALAGLIERTPAWLEAKFEAASLDVLEDEEMYTETLLLERTGDGYDLWWYMEADNMEQVGEAYYETDNRVARVSEHVLGWVLERPEHALAHPTQASDFELLAHAVDGGRE